MAQQIASAGNDVQGIFGNDIMGQPGLRSHQARSLYRPTVPGGVPTNVTSNQIALLASARRVGGEATTNEQTKPRKGGHDGDGE
jgi:hypothetical protein